MNADFARAMKRLVPDRLRRRWTDRKIARKKFSCSTFMMYLGVEGTFDLPHHTIHIAADYARNLDEIENQHVLSDDPSFLRAKRVRHRPDARAARQQRALRARARHAPAPERRLVARARALPRKNACGRSRRPASPMSSGAFASSASSRPPIGTRRYEIHQGATFNLAHSLDQMLHLRPHNRFEDVDGMYLVGGGTHPGSGLPVIFESARISSRLLLADLGIASRHRRDAARAACAAQIGASVMSVADRPSDSPDRDFARVRVEDTRRLRRAGRKPRHIAEAPAHCPRTCAISSRKMPTRSPPPPLRSASVHVAEKLVSEVLPLADACRWLERNAARVLAPRRCGKRGRPFWMRGVSFEVQRQPFGVVLVIGPGKLSALSAGRSCAARARRRQCRAPQTRARHA